MIRRMVFIALPLLLVGTAYLARPAAAADCPFPGQRAMLSVQLFFGRDVAGRAPVSEAEWRTFLAETVTPRFPAGLTAFDAYGQWQDPRTGRIGREDTKALLIVVEDTAAVREWVGELAADWRSRFRQQSVGLVTQTVCAAF